MKQAVLISIHPEHIDNIMSGKKVFEYRKILPKHDILFLVLYCTAPVKKITAVAEVLGRVVGSPAHVWNVTSFLAVSITITIQHGNLLALSFLAMSTK